MEVGKRLPPGSKGLRTIAREELPPKLSGMMGVHDGNVRASHVITRMKQTAKNNPPGTGTLVAQRAGVLYKKPFYSKGLINNSSWKKCYFVLKDSFLIWYNKPPAGGTNFSIHPAGVLPLGGCSVFPEGRSGKGYSFEVSHPEFNGRTLQLKTDDVEDAKLWLDVLEQCRVATLDNALYGAAQATYLKAKGSSLEQETEEALAVAQQRAEEASGVALEKQQIMEENLIRQEEYKRLYAERKREAADAEDRLRVREKSMKSKKKAVAQERRSVRKIKKELGHAHTAVQKLNEIRLSQPKLKRKKGLKKDLEQLEKFLSVVLQFDQSPTP